MPILLTAVFGSEFTVRGTAATLRTGLSKIGGGYHAAVARTVVLSLVVAVALSGCGGAKRQTAVEKRTRCQTAWDHYVPPPSYSGDRHGGLYVNECATRAGGYFSPQDWERECLASLICAGQFGQTRTGREGSGGGPGGEGSSPSSTSPPPP